VITTTDHHVFANVKIYSNLAEIIQPLGELPIEFSAEDWANIRSDSITLVGSNVNVTQQTIIEKKKSLNNHEVYVRSPSSSNTNTKFLKATMINENRNLVKVVDKDISEEPIFFTVPSDHIVYDNEPPESKYYINFTYDTMDAVYLSYLRSNLNWKTRYQLNLFEESKKPILIVMADIRNDGKSKIDIEHAELLGGDINLRMAEETRVARYEAQNEAMSFSSFSPPTVAQGKEVAGLYVFYINHPFSIDGKSNYLLPMFRPQVTVERYGLIIKNYFSGVGKSTGKAQRSYRLSSDRFLSGGNCIIREYDRLVGETSLPDLAAKDKYEFSIGEDSDIIYKENVTLISSITYNETIQQVNKVEQRTQSIYAVSILLKNFKTNRPMKVEFRQIIHGQSVKLVTPNAGFTQYGTTMECKTTLVAEEEKRFSYDVQVIT
jgi:hypothetical protein